VTALLALMLALTPVPDDPGGEAVLDSLVSVLQRAEDYTVRLEIEVDIERMSVPPMEATLYYKRPDRVHIDADGVAMIPREVLPASIAALPRNFSVERVERDTLNGRRILRLSLEPRRSSTRTRQLSLAVDPATWLPLELSSSRLDGRSITADFAFASVEGFWLPSEVVIRFDAVADDTSDGSAWEQNPSAGRRSSMPRRGTVRILYRDYRVNTGLPEEMFAPQNGAESSKEDRP
jgi:hypothetical protein